MRRAEIGQHHHIGIHLHQYAGEMAWGEEGAPNTPIPGPADRLLRLVTAHALFEEGFAHILVDLLPEISDTHPNEIVMVYSPHAKAAEPSLFPDDADDGERWRPTKAA
jgi:hypothetical protein